MPEYETILPFANANSQAMTARWMRRVINNLWWSYESAIYGASPFRIVKHVANVDATTWQTAYWGRIYYVQDTLRLHYDLLAGKTDTEDNAGVLNPNFSGDCDNAWGSLVSSFQFDGINHDLEMRLCLKKGSTWYCWDQDGAGDWAVLSSDANRSTHIAKHTPIPTSADNLINYGFDCGLTGLGLTVGDVYDVRVQVRNCAVTIHKLYTENLGGVIGGFTYGLPASVADGAKLHYHDWNLYLTSLNYLKTMVDTPRGPTWGVYQRNADKNGDDTPIRVWRGWVKHMGSTLKWRCLHHYYPSAGGNVTTSVLYNGVVLESKVDNGTGATEWKVFESTHDLTDHGLTLGNWYEVQVKCTSSNSGDNNPQCTVDYVFEVDGVPAVGLNTVRPSHGDYVAGSVTMGLFGMADLQADFALVKTAADRVLQLVCPDVATDATWPVGLYYANDLSFIRQRTMLMWAGSGLSIYWGAGEAPKSQALGAGTTGILDLRALDGLDIGVRYWLNPRASVVYALEV